MLQEYTGKVTKKPFGTGSKSAHDAVRLETKDGSFVLRRIGGNPFQDPELDKLVGKTIRCRGELLGYTLTISDWSEISPER